MKILTLAVAAGFLDVVLQSGVAGYAVLLLAGIGLLARGLAAPLPQ